MISSFRWYSASGLARSQSPTRQPCYGRHLAVEQLEPRCLLSGSSVADAWSSLVFDGGAAGSLGLQFSRDIATVNQAGDVVAIDEPRYGDARLLTDVNDWSLVLSDLGTSQLFGSGWDHDGQNPLALIWNPTSNDLTFVRGTSFDTVTSVSINVNGGDLMRGEVAGFRYQPRHAVVYEGLVVFAAQRDRLDAGNWIPEGVSFVWTQDYGQTMTRVAQAGGGFDVPAIAGGVADGLDRLRGWSFTNAFSEQPGGDLLGAWFPWADYLRRVGNPQGGQIGLFRARRPDVGSPWVVEPNVLVYERWEPNDAGGLHAHTAGMLTDGLASFWGDVGYRNHVVRHIADDLENYTTATWTHKTDFQGDWSPDQQRVYNYGTQPTAAAPGQVFGEILVAGDEQPELIAKVQAPANPDGKAIITNQRGSFVGSSSGNSKSPRTSIWLHHMPDVGYVAREFNMRLNVLNSAFHFSADGETWGSLLNLGSAQPYLFGNQLIIMFEEGLHAAPLPQVVAQRSPLLLRPGGTNLAEANWAELVPPAIGNELRRVNYANGLYTYADTGQPLADQPQAPPPVADEMPLWEVISDGSDRDLGQWQPTSTATSGSDVHWLSSWHYSLDGDGIAPQTQLGSNAASAKQSVWFANSHWVPTLSFGAPDDGNTNPAVQPIELFNGNFPAPRRWLMAIEGYTTDEAPSYPLPPATTGPDEIATVSSSISTETWTVGLTFGLPQVSSFSSHFDPLGAGAIHPIASLLGSGNGRIDVSFFQASAANGVITVDVVENGFLMDRLTFSSLIVDREDQVRLLISNSPDEFGATVLVTREGFGVESKTIVGSGAPVIAKKIRLSDATQTSVSATEWYAIQVNDTQALTASERESFIVSANMFANNDSAGTPVALKADFDEDGDVDGADFLNWQQSFGMQFRAELADGDSDGDEDVDVDDLRNWESQFTARVPADFDLDVDVDGADFLTWQRNVGATGATLAEGDANGDGKVDADDLALWEANFRSLGGAPLSMVVDDGALALLELVSLATEGGEETTVAEPTPTAAASAYPSEEVGRAPSRGTILLQLSQSAFDLAPARTEFATSRGVMPVDQPAVTLPELRSTVAKLDDAEDRESSPRGSNDQYDAIADQLFWRLGDDDPWILPLRFQRSPAS